MGSICYRIPQAGLKTVVLNYSNKSTKSDSQAPKMQGESKLGLLNNL